MKKVLGAVFLFALTAFARAQTQETVEVVRDANGTPHVFATTNPGACHGAGYVAARDRLFQMEFFRRAMRGTLSEILPANPYALALNRDKYARTIGFARYADELLANPGFDSATKAMLEAYAAGVNVRLREIANGTAAWPPMFTALGVSSMANWQAADCVLVWMFAQDLFGAFGAGDLNPDPVPTYAQLDLGAAVLPDLGNNMFVRLLQEMKIMDTAPAVTAFPAEPKIKASHNLVIHGGATASGKPLFLGKPQHMVTAPSLYYEYAMRASQGDLDCRGAGLAGCPAFFHGWNRFACWSLTSMGADLTDIYSIDFTNPGHTIYKIDGVQYPITEFSEQINVLGGSPIQWKHRRTVWGPLTTPWNCSPVGCVPPSGNTPEYSTRSLILDDALLQHKHTITGAIELMRSANKPALVAGLRKWRSPSGHLLVATTAGDIGYRALTGLPLRPVGQPMVGVLDGSTSASDWPGEVNFTALPAFWGDPWTQYGKRYLTTANNLACNPALLPQPFVLGEGGDTDRSWRIREMVAARLAQPPLVTSSDVFVMDKDTTNAVIRTFVVLARVMDGQGFILPPGQQMLANLVTWNTPWKWDANTPPNVWETLRSIRFELKTFAFNATSGWSNLVVHYGARHYGVIRMLRELAGNEQNYATINAFPNELKNWVNAMLLNASQNVTIPAPPVSTSHLLQHQVNLMPLISANSSNYPAQDQTLTGFTGIDTPSEIWAQPGETYKFMADFDAALYPDANWAMLAPGVSEDWNDASLYLNHVAGWKSGTMYRAKLTRGQFAETGVKTMLYP